MRLSSVRGEVAVACLEAANARPRSGLVGGAGSAGMMRLLIFCDLRAFSMSLDNVPDSSVSPQANAAEPAAPASNRRRGGQGQRPSPEQAPSSPNASKAHPAPLQHPLLEVLARLYPAVFGDKPMPLKRGIFEDLMTAQPEALPSADLKAALAQHTRSTRYLNAMAAGLARHSLTGEPVEQPTPEQVHHALIEVFRRRLRRTREDLRPELRRRILMAYEASGLDRESYAERVHGRDEEVNQLTRDALAEAAHRAARDEALLRAYEASGKTVEAFADMYGMLLAEACSTLDRARRLTRPVEP